MLVTNSVERTSFASDNSLNPHFFDTEGAKQHDLSSLHHTGS